ncbi:MAG: tRNA guanosine(34) transglycosylase Tgt [Marinilabiliaceae bacterium]|nr:tRNA guanosine(34) transglycosylase Tgt [Marinilabiliaceae bacterium]
MFFVLQNSDKFSHARAGSIKTDHGDIETPVFMPVGTAGSVKGIDVKALDEQAKATIILGNTYHLYLRPGIEVMRQAGGLHNFCAWKRPILTDSGGFQVFSLSQRRKLSENGAEFQSHIDGSKHLFTPENVVDTQRIIGADIIMALDECAPGDSDIEYAKKSMELTHRWLKRGIEHFENTKPLYNFSQTFFPIVQGCCFKDLRKQSADFVSQFNCAGNAIGGLAVGEPQEVMYEMIEVVNNILPLDKPRYLMGVGTPANILEAISLGIDMFDCVIPTRNGRNGMLFTQNGIINIKNEKWKYDFTKIDETGTCEIDITYSKAYLRHLFISGEMLGPQIASIHNLAFYSWLMQESRKHILKNSFVEWKNKIIKQIMVRL